MELTAARAKAAAILEPELRRITTQFPDYCRDWRVSDGQETGGAYLFKLVSADGSEELEGGAVVEVDKATEAATKLPWFGRNPPEAT